MREVAKDLGISKSGLTNWVALADRDAGSSPGPTREDQPSRGSRASTLTVARVAEGLAVSSNTANDAVLAEGRLVRIGDPGKEASVALGA